MHHFVTEFAQFCYKMVHCGIWDWCIVGFAQQVYLQSTFFLQLTQNLRCVQ